MLFCCPSIGGKDFAAEAKNILPHPFEGKLLIHQPVVATRMAFVVDCRMREESE
jgi:hypothetical protein